MDVTRSLVLLGGLSPAAFTRRHWQKRPLLVRQAMPGVRPPLDRAGLFALAAREGVESRLVSRGGDGWRLRHGPVARRALPPLARPGWTLLVQGVDLHVPAAHALLGAFRFVPAARLDDLMVSYASDRGGVGPHVDSYDVFLLQVEGRRRWHIGRAPGARLREGVPLKMLADFRPEESCLLEPGDLLYLPPGWGHDGVAEGGDCITCSIGFRAPRQDVLAADLLSRLGADLADRAADVEADSPPGRRGSARLYRDAAEAASPAPGRVPTALKAFARDAIERALRDPDALARALGEALTEPKAQVVFDAAPTVALAAVGAVALDRRSRMLYDERHVFLNGESFRAGGRDAKLMRRLADERRLEGREIAALTAGAREVIADWLDDGWLREDAT